MRRSVPGQSNQMPRSSNPEKQRKQRIVAAGVVAGKSYRQIAQAAGCTPGHIAKLAEDPSTQLLIKKILAPHARRLDRIALRAINAVEKALIAKTTDKADHMARLRAVGRYTDLLRLAQGPVKEEPLQADRGLVTWEEFCILYRQRQEAKHDTEPA